MRKGFVAVIVIITVIVIIIVSGAVYFDFKTRQEINQQTQQTQMEPKPIVTPDTSNFNSPTPLAQNNVAGKDCGKVTSQGGNIPALDARANTIEECFWASYSNNKPATLTFSTMGADSGSTTYFSTDTMGKISGYSQSFMAPRSTGEKDTFTCMKLTSESRGLYAAGCKFASGTKQDILIPAFK